MNDDYNTLADRELERWPGVIIERGLTNGGHRWLRLTYAGQSRRVTYPLSPSDWRGPRRHITDIRRTLQALGAQREDRR